MDESSANEDEEPVPRNQGIFPARCGSLEFGAWDAFFERYARKQIMIEGGCLCGAVRYALTEPALRTCLCHCVDCRKASGAHAVAWTFFHTGALEWKQGVPKMIRFAERERSFCGDCGTPLMFFDPAIPHLFEVSTCSLDEPGAFPPEDQCWLVDELAWSEATHALPRYGEYSPLPE